MRKTTPTERLTSGFGRWVVEIAFEQIGRRPRSRSRAERRVGRRAKRRGGMVEGRRIVFRRRIHCREVNRNQSRGAARRLAGVARSRDAPCSPRTESHFVRARAGRRRRRIAERICGQESTPFGRDRRLHRQRPYGTVLVVDRRPVDCRRPAHWFQSRRALLKAAAILICHRLFHAVVVVFPAELIFFSDRRRVPQSFSPSAISIRPPSSARARVSPGLSDD